MIHRPGVEVATLTDVGCQRENNEDRCVYCEPLSDARFEEIGRIAVVADGMGGYEGGQEASRIAVETIQQLCTSAEGDNPQQLLLEGLKTAHQKIQEYANEHPALMGMGTTCTAIALVKTHLYYAHIGDSRLYLLRGEKLSRITHDDSYVNRLVETGVICPEEAENHPHRHILTAALGASPEINPEWPSSPLVLETGDTLMLCTDGLWGLVNDTEVKNFMGMGSVDDVCRKLVQLARDRGGPDNITVLTLRIGTSLSYLRAKKNPELT